MELCHSRRFIRYLCVIMGYFDFVFLVGLVVFVYFVVGWGWGFGVWHPLGDGTGRRCGMRRVVKDRVAD